MFLTLYAKAGTDIFDKGNLEIRKFKTFIIKIKKYLI